MVLFILVCYHCMLVLLALHCFARHAVRLSFEFAGSCRISNSIVYFAWARLPQNPQFYELVISFVLYSILLAILMPGHPSNAHLNILGWYSPCWKSLFLGDSDRIGFDIFFRLFHHTFLLFSLIWSDVGAFSSFTSTSCLASLACMVNCEKLLHQGFFSSAVSSRKALNLWTSAVSFSLLNFPVFNAPCFVSTDTAPFSLISAPCRHRVITGCRPGSEESIMKLWTMSVASSAPFSAEFAKIFLSTSEIWIYPQRRFVG